jgi:hypothetical protein
MIGRGFATPISIVHESHIRAIARFVGMRRHVWWFYRCPCQRYLFAVFLKMDADWIFDSNGEILLEICFQ